MATDRSYRHSAGWRYLALTLMMGKSFLAVPVLEDLQAYAVSVKHRSWSHLEMGHSRDRS